MKKRPTFSLFLIPLVIGACARAPEGALRRPGPESPLPHYDLRIDLDSSARSYSGELSLSLDLDQRMVDLGFYLLPQLTDGGLSITNATINGTDARVESPQRGVAAVGLAGGIPAGPTVVDLSFEGRIPAIPVEVGIFFSQAGSFALGGAYPGLIPMKDGTWTAHPPEGFGDPPSLALADYDVTLRIPEDYSVAGTGDERATGRTEGFRTWTARATAVREFFAAGSTDWRRLTVRSDGVRYVSYYQSVNPYQGINAAYQARDAIEILEKALGTYPYREFDVIACPLPNRAGGMEYPGIVAINSFFYDPANGDQGLGANLVLEIILAHEAAHQWFYDLVGNDAVEEPWLDEAFAQHFTWYYFEGKYGPGGGDLQYTGFENRWNRTDRSMKAANLPAYEYDNLEYGSIVYGRAPLFLQDLMRAVGDDAFYGFVSDYIARWSWGVVTTQDFDSMMDEYFPQEGPAAFDQWILGQEP